ncbi:D-alanyl-D-alanine carboxypeptidase/D-alanyl-D-alanine endopeptidase [Streptomyces ochraceiscleroticus]|uniref:D-alanyl-D-alanine carboxypeptidase/D-alanyl-D-alanine-endopeptidase n=1 Tax=Streptomyces ochraceiscleroticus TaxID=47761 RepID=A0ABW1MNM2_9ACTN|nr:D-alanyl-D-alanine carboxypeptidase/D-alanyl-D-alanine-endopeptidase [Streptomyces ochraceiscleroticus]
MPEARSWQVRWVGWGRSCIRAAAGAGRSTAQFAADEWFFARQWWRRTPLQRKRTWQVTAGSAVAGLAVAAGAVATAGPWDSGQRTAERARAARWDGRGGERHGAGPSAPGAAPVLAALGAPVKGGGDGVPPPTGSGLADALAPLLKAPELGPVRTASVVDVATGREVFASHPARTATPASTIKLGTAVAALTALGPEHRFTTKAVQDGRTKDGTARVVLVGGGDPTLTARTPRAGTPAAQRPAALGDLAADTARALKKRGTKKVTLGYDDSLYEGSPQHPIGPNENLAPVTALTADEARLDTSSHGTAPRATDPSAEAARAFADDLRAHGIAVTGAPRDDDARRTATRLAAARSLPLSTIVERMLTHSDNDIAEQLARQTAVATGAPTTFKGGGRAVQRTLEQLRLPVARTAFHDGSGLDRDDRVSAGLLSHVLLLAAAPDHPELRAVLTGLPVAGFTGTLEARYADERAGAGAVRAKTGTLTGVNTLAGTVVDADGRLLTFAFMTNGTSDAYGAQRSLDRLASAVANCGCR